MDGEVNAYICIQCSSMEWTVHADRYFSRHHVRDDGHVEFEEEFNELEIYCSKCGSEAALLAVRGKPSDFRILKRLKPMERILQALEWIVEGEIKADEDITPDEVLEMARCFCLRNKGEGEELKRFFSKAEEIIGKWKLLTEP